MANQISKLLLHVAGIFEDNSLVNTIVFKDDDVFDVEKENIYPLVSMALINSVKADDLVSISMSFEILNQRDYIPESTPSKLMLDTNYIDNINICDSIGNDFILEISKTHNDLDINTESYSEFEYIRKDERNCLDGVRFEVLFSMHQNDV